MNKIQGKILTKESSVGIPNLLVVIYDIDQRTANDIKKSYKDETQNPQPVNLNYYWANINGDRIGSVITGKEGEFELSYENSEFMIDKKELRPDLILFVLAPEEEREVQTNNPLSNPNLSVASGSNQSIDAIPKILYMSRAIRANAGKLESYLIKIPEKILANSGISVKSVSSDLSEKKINIQKDFQDSFELNNTIKKALDDVTKDRLKIATATKQKAKHIFHPLMLSSVKPEIRNSPTYFHATDDLQKKHKDVINQSLKKKQGMPVNEKRRSFLTIITSAGNENNLPANVNEIVQSILDNLHGASITRVISEFPKDYLQIAKDYISKIISASSTINPSSNA